MPKTIQRYKVGDDVPGSAVFLASGIDRTGALSFYYEVKEKVSRESIGVNYSKIAEDVIQYLNIHAGKSYSGKTETTRKLIKARILDGLTEQQLKTVVDNKIKDWKDDPKMEQYLRPQTLFGNKCESYLNMRDAGQDAFGELDAIMAGVKKL